MIRIIAGIHRGRRLSTPPGRKVRPTSDRARTALFNILGPWIPGRRVLDLYAGAGGVGFECLSRGAAHVTFVEEDAAAIECLTENTELLGEDARVTVFARSVRGGLEALVGRAFDLIYADPPYRDAYVSALLQRLSDAGIAHDDSIAVIEHSRRTAVEMDTMCAGWRCYRNAAYGKTTLSFFAMESETE